MRKLIFAFGALVIAATSLPAIATTSAEARTVIVRHDGDRGHMRRGWNRGHHYGWNRGHHWNNGRRHHNRTVVIHSRRG